jgi:hypothetical protein
MKRKYALAIVLVAAFSPGGACPSETNAAQSLALIAVSKSLDGKTQCVAFQWEPDGAKIAVTLPVQIEGRTYRFQFDTGATANIIYSTIADRAGWSKPTDHSFQPVTFRVGDTIMSRPWISIFRDKKVTHNISGTLGLWNLIGRITVIDYPGQRVCLFADADLPQELPTGTSVSATLRNGKLFVPVQVGSFASDNIVFDTGSSEFPLIVDLANWSKLSGQTEAEKAPVKREALAWGKSVLLVGAPASSQLKLGELELGIPIVFTKQDAPDGFAKMSYKVDGIMGNAPVWDGIVVLDLTANVQFRFIR